MGYAVETVDIRPIRVPSAFYTLFIKCGFFVSEISLVAALCRDDKLVELRDIANPQSI
ncbi:hypothetical protein N9161_04790 [Porticoccaceae bacterium]|nr:hypothetical protein [Porticoccaceae bacterium]